MAQGYAYRKGTSSGLFLSGGELKRKEVNYLSHPIWEESPHETLLQEFRKDRGLCFVHCCTPTTATMLVT